MTRKEWVRANPIAERALIYHSPYEQDDRPPFQFGFASDEREWLRTERTEEELVEFTKNTEVSLELYTMFYNTDGFRFITVECTVKKTDDGFALFANDNGEDVEFGTVTLEESEKEKIAFFDGLCASGETIDVDVIMFNDETTLLFPELEDMESDEDELDGRTIGILLQYIENLQIHSYFDLCRKANKAVANMRKYNENLKENGIFDIEFEGDLFHD